MVLLDLTRGQLTLRRSLPPAAQHVHWAGRRSSWASGLQEGLADGPGVLLMDGEERWKRRHARNVEASADA